MKRVLIIMIVSMLVLAGCSVSQVDEKDGDKVVETVVETSVETSVETVVEKQIYETVEVEASWAIDVSDPKTVIDDADYVVKVRITGIVETGAFSEGSFFPSTPIYIEELETLKGEAFSDINTIYQWGGLVTIQEVIDISSEERVKKMCLDILTDEQRATMYMEYTSESNYNFEVGKEYVVALRGDEHGDFHLGADGYCVFTQKMNTGSSVEEYENVITKNIITLDNIID